MQQSPLISLPPKTTGDVDWASPLRQHIATVYGEAPDSYAEECASLQRSRQDAVRGAGSDMTARDLLYKYFGQLELLELRFPDIKVPFPWNDAFTSKPTTQTSLAFEKASVIFQIASTLSSLSQAQNRSDPEGLKRAYHFARSSAGMLVYINDNFLHAPSTDLSKEVVKFLVGIMLAQAQEIFTEKVAEEGKSKKGGNASMVARLAAQAAFLYTALGEEVKDFFGKGIIDRNWVGLINAKAKHFVAFSQYYRAIADEGTNKYGDGIVRLNLAEQAAKEAHRLAGVFNSTVLSSASTTLPSDAGTTLLEITKSHLALVSERRVTAVKDNDLIYHSILPSEASLLQVEKLAAAQPIPIQETYSTPDVSKLIGPDIFARLIPLAVTESASVYSEEKAKLARAEVEKSDLAEGEVQASLEHLCLPSGLNKFKAMLVGRDGVGGLDALAIPPAQALRWSEEVQGDAERGEDLERLLVQLEQSKKEVVDDLDWVQTQLDAESRDCESMRAKFGGSWSQLPSASLTKSQREDLRSQRTAVQSASQSDERIFALHQSIQSALAALRTTDALGQVYAEAVAGSTGQPNLLDLDVATEEQGQAEREDTKKLIGEIEERLGRLQRLKRERSDSLKDLKEHIRSDDPSQALLINRRNAGGESSLFASELEKFRPYQSRLSTAIDHEKATLHEIAGLLEDLTNMKGARETEEQWKGAEKRVRELGTRLSKAVGGYQEVKKGLRRGLDFYQQIQSLTESLRHSVRSFVTTRTEERTRLVTQKTAASISPPPRAPPGGTSYPDWRINVASPPPLSQASPSPYSSHPPPSSAPQAAPISSYGYTSPPPPSSIYPSQAQALASNPWDFGSMAAGLPSAFQTSPSPSAVTPSTSQFTPYPSTTPNSSYSSPLPPSQPPSQPQNNTSYPAPPSARQQHSYSQPYSSFPPPPPQNYSHSSPYPPASPAPYGQPQRQGSYPPPPPPPQQPAHSGQYSPYGPSPPPPPPSHSQQPYSPYGAPPPSNPYGGSPPPFKLFSSSPSFSAPVKRSCESS